MLQRGLTLAVPGIAISVGLAYGAGRVLANRLYEVSAMDPLVLTAATGLVFAFALAESYISDATGRPRRSDGGAAGGVGLWADFWRSMDALTWPVIRHALVYGAVLSTVLAALLLAVLWMNPEILLNDYPPDIRTRFGPMSERSKRQRIPVALLMGAVSLAIVIASFSTIRTNADGTIPFRTAFVHLFVMFSVFNVVDLLLIDWPLVAIGPRFIVLPGTEGSAGYKDYWFHFRGFLVGAVLVFVASGAMAAAIAAVF